MTPVADEELLLRQFRFEDPEGIEGLSRARPDRDLEPEIVGYYDVRPSGGRAADPDAPFIWCCHCQKRTHWDGRVIRDRSGATYIIGADCGRAHYGDSFQAIDRVFDEQMARQGLLRRWATAAALRDMLLDELETVLGDPAWHAVDRTRRELHAAAPNLARRLAKLAHRDAPLVIRSIVRDDEAEARRDERYRRARAAYNALPKAEQAQARREGVVPRRDETSIMRPHSEDLGPIRGRLALIDDGDVRGRAVRLKTVLQTIAPVGHVAGIRNAQLKRSLAELGDAGRALREAFVETGAAWRFFQPENLRRIERWLNATEDAARTPYLSSRPMEALAKLRRVAPLARAAHFYPPTLEALLRPFEGRG